MQNIHLSLPVWLFVLFSFLHHGIATPATFYAANSRPVPRAHTRNGTYLGRHISSFNQDVFLGIPYAHAPRLSNPVSVNTSWSGERSVVEYGPTCYGFGSNTLLNLTQSEDCLSLNVVRPSGYAGDPLPVLLWIYGGGFRQGASADPMWNLSYVVETSVKNQQKVLAVSINYRLSFLGFPAGKQAAAAGITNLGLKDQRIALQWVQENIAAFGGDPRKVTVWGESAGATSVADQILAYGGRGGKELFRGGILASGFFTRNNHLMAANKQLQDSYNAIVNSANCDTVVDTLECLRSAPLSAIWPAEDNGANWSPVIDGDFLRRAPADEVEGGNVARVPILLGGNSDEGLFLASLFNLTIDNAAELIAQSFPAASKSTIDKLVALYPPRSPEPPYSLPVDFPWCAAMAKVHLSCGDEWRRFAAIIGDWFSGAPRRLMAQQWARLGLPTYSYRFDTNPSAVPLVNWIGLGPGFATHGAELAYEFGLPPGFTTPIDFYPPVLNVSSHIAVSHAMVSKWIAFAHSGDPNGISLPGVPRWPSYDHSASNMVFNATADGGLHIHIEPDTYRAKAIEFWNAHPDELGNVGA